MSLSCSALSDQQTKTKSFLIHKESKNFYAFCMKNDEQLLGVVTRIFFKTGIDRFLCILFFFKNIAKQKKKDKTNYGTQIRRVYVSILTVWQNMTQLKESRRSLSSRFLLTLYFVVMADKNIYNAEGKTMRCRCNTLMAETGNHKLET